MRKILSVLVLGLLLDASTPTHLQAASPDDGKGVVVTVDTGIRLTTQACRFWCWAAAIQMISGKFGIPVTQCEVVSARFANPLCCDPVACYTSCDQGANGPNTITAALQAYKIRGVYEPNALSADLLRATLDAGSPVLAATRPHAFVISGYQRVDGVYSYRILDPFPLTGDHWVSYSELRNYGDSEWEFSWYNFE